MILSFRLPRNSARESSYPALGLALAALLLVTTVRAADHLRYLPADTRVVVTLNVSALPEQYQDPWKKFGELLYAASLTPELKGNNQAVSNVTSLTFAMPYAGWPGGMVIVRGKVEAKLLAEQARRCARLSRGAVAELKPVKGRPMPVFHRKVSEKSPLLPLPEQLATWFKSLTTGSDIYFAAMDEETLIVTINPLAGLLGLLQPPGESAILHAVQSRSKFAKPRASASLLELLKKQDSQAWLSCVIMGNALDPRLALAYPDLNSTFQRWKHVTGSVHGVNQIEATLVATAKDENEAQELEKFAQDKADKMVLLMPLLSLVPRQKEVLTELAKSIRVSRKGEVVTATGKIASDRIRLLFVPVRLTKD